MLFLYNSLVCARRYENSLVCTRILPYILPTQLLHAAADAPEQKHSDV